MSIIILFIKHLGTTIINTTNPCLLIMLEFSDIFGYHSVFRADLYLASGANFVFVLCIIINENS